MDRKLLFEVDLADESSTNSEKAKLLSLISRGAGETGELDDFGDRVFTDARVRGALASLPSDAIEGLVNAITALLAPPSVSVETIKRSLSRVLDLKQSGEQPTPGATSTQSPVGPPAPPKGQESELDHHVGNKSALIREMFEQVDTFALAVGPDVTRRVRKQYLSCFRGKKSFISVEVQTQRLIVFLGLNPNWWCQPTTTSCGTLAT